MKNDIITAFELKELLNSINAGDVNYRMVSLGDSGLYFDDKATLLMEIRECMNNHILKNDDKFILNSYESEFYVVNFIQMDEEVVAVYKAELLDDSFTFYIINDTIHYY